MSFVKNRDTRAGSTSFRREAKRRAAAKGGSRRGGITPGQFERFRTDTKMQWVRIVPQSYTYPVYVADEGKVVEVTRPFYEFVQHYYKRKNRFVQCSASPHRDKPCYPDAILNAWWEEKKEIQERTGVKPNYDNKPLSRSARLVWAVTGVDKYYQIPATDKKGKVRTNAKGDAILNYVAAPVARLTKGTTYPHVNGHNMHWNFGTEHLEQLLAIDDELMDVCGNCATNMHTFSLTCADCGEVEVEFDDAVSGADLLKLRNDSGSCSKCGGDDVVPILECEGCDDPVEGGLLDFEVRICHEEIGDKKVLLKVKDWRLPSDDEEIIKLVSEPLDVMKIYAPDPIKLQAKILGDICDGVDPSYGAWDKKPAEGYGSSDEDDKEKSNDESMYS